MRLRKILAVLLVAAGLTGVAAQTASAADGIHRYTDWAWSVDGWDSDWVGGYMKGTSLHYEGGGYTGLTSAVKSCCVDEDYPAKLYRDLSWVDDGYARIATGSGNSWVYDDKRYQMPCGSYIRFRMTDGRPLPGGTVYSYSSKYYAKRGSSGEVC